MKKQFVLIYTVLIYTVLFYISSFLIMWSINVKFDSRIGIEYLILIPIIPSVISGTISYFIVKTFIKKCNNK